MRPKFKLQSFIFRNDLFLKKRRKKEWELNEKSFFRKVFRMTVMRYYIRYFRKINLKSKLQVNQMLKDEKQRFLNEKEEVHFIKYLIKNKI